MVGPGWMVNPQATQGHSRLLFVALVGAAIVEAPQQREACVFRRRLDWNVHKQILLLEGQFKRCYRMEASSFELLLSLIRPTLARDEMKSTNRTGTDQLQPENMLQMTLSWLAGGNYMTIRGLAGMSPSGIYGCMHAVMDAMCHCPELRIHSPTESQERIHDLAESFTNINEAAFFSGHYQKFGVNVQAICDAFSRFTCYCMNFPGKVVGDNAYPLSDSLLVPFNKLELKSRKHSDFNFYLNQLRIRIEMAFGLLVNKWGIFKRSLVVDFVNVKKVIKTCMKLPNFCIDERIKNEESAKRLQVVSMEYHNLPESEYQPTDNSESTVGLRNDAQGRILREVVVDHIQCCGLQRPKRRHS
ncbi:hypothetical protein PPTG_03832 [Phytophthora nicotianae INRA-310]|uniref:DDE Tnp4 domain-containing protein n=1 Tax=Phytophthora nicotianae (strain INRA-310) TaxID=761204 RepID=W2QY34_PHYN3|nr:hypothetical protein PPTG_03832 [Phytophthora nicotianae INRA-310]ETN18137.1 hypothetical protein PPTG_03832 [Phytophthora nicotianae INRA-310]